MRADTACPGAGEPEPKCGRVALWKRLEAQPRSLFHPAPPTVAAAKLGWWVGKSDSQLACLRGQGDLEPGPTPATQTHPPSLASSSHSPWCLIPAALMWVRGLGFPIPRLGPHGACSLC